MKDFAKLYDTKHGQILITNDTRYDLTSENDLPSINTSFMINDGVICELSMKFKDTEEGIRECDEAFDSVTLHTAIGMVEGIISTCRNNKDEIN